MILLCSCLASIVSFWYAIKRGCFPVRFFSHLYFVLFTMWFWNVSLSLSISYTSPLGRALELCPLSPVAWSKETTTYTFVFPPLIDWGQRCVHSCAIAESWEATKLPLFIRDFPVDNNVYDVPIATLVICVLSLWWIQGEGMVKNKFEGLPYHNTHVPTLENSFLTNFGSWKPRFTNLKTPFNISDPLCQTSGFTTVFLLIHGFYVRSLHFVTIPLTLPIWSHVLPK